MDDSCSMDAEVAPLPVAIADHLLKRFAQAHKGHPDTETLFVSTVREKRRASFAVLDPYVRSGALTRPIVLDKLKIYGHEPAQSTITHWQRRGLIEMERSGKIKPLSAQSVIIAGMIDPGQRGFLPPDGVPTGDTWRCYIQRSPDAEVEIWPVGRLSELPPATLCWTPSASAYWSEGWHLIGEDEGFVGCIRFAGVKRVRGHIWYDIGIDALRIWDAETTALYTPFSGDTLAPVQILCYVVFHRLALSRLGKRKGFGYAE